MDKIDLVIGMLEDQGNHGAAYYVRIAREQRDELLDALKSVSAWSESLDRIMPTWLDSEVDEAIANAEK